MVIYKADDLILRTIFSSNVAPIIGDRVYIRTNKVDEPDRYKVVDRILEVGCICGGMYEPNTQVWNVILEKDDTYTNKNID